MRVLITGGAGYIGSHAVRRFLAAGHEVRVVDNLVAGHAAAVPAELLVAADAGDTDRMFSLLTQGQIDTVVHFAAFTYVGESVRDPERYYQNNLVKTLGLLAAMRRAGVARLVFSSTCATYGIPARVPITEDEPQQPINPYGRAKLAVEWALRDYAAAYSLGFASLRYFNAAGASPGAELGEDHDPETHLIPLVLGVALGQRPHIEVFGADYPTPDGTCIRDYIHVDDLAEAHLLAAGDLQPGMQRVYNLGIGRGYSVREVIQVCERITGRPIPVQLAERRPGDPPVLVAAPDRARRELGWAPRYDTLEAIVQTAWDWHRSHPHGFAAQPRPLSGSTSNTGASVAH